MQNGLIFKIAMVVVSLASVIAATVLVLRNLEPVTDLLHTLCKKITGLKNRYFTPGPLTEE